MTGIACLGCYHGRSQTYVPGAAEGRLTSRVLGISRRESLRREGMRAPRRTIAGSPPLPSDRPPRLFI